MSKKTKKQKLLAELHRIKQSNNPTHPPVATQPSPSKSVNYRTPETTNRTSPQSETNYDFVFKDLRLTLILTALAIGAQLCVYYLLVVKHLL